MASYQAKPAASTPTSVAAGRVIDSRSGHSLLPRVSAPGRAARVSWGGVLAALPTRYGVGHQQVSGPTALVGDEQLDHLIASPGGFQAGRGSRWPDHRRRVGAARLGCGRARRWRTGRLAARARRLYGEPEHRSEREGHRGGDQQPCPRCPPLWRLEQGGWLGLPTDRRCGDCGCRIGLIRLEPARPALPLDRLGLPQGGPVDLPWRQPFGLRGCPPRGGEPLKIFDLGLSSVLLPRHASSRALLDLQVTRRPGRPGRRGASRRWSRRRSARRPGPACRPAP